MEKKPEEIMAIVLDYCHHACPEIGKNVPLYEGAYLKKDIDGYGIYHYWGSDRGNATCICTVPTRSTFIANPNVFTAFHKLLGLDKRDALEAEREKITNLEQQLEEAQNVKFEGMASPAWAMLGELTKFMEEALESDVPRMTNWRIRLEDGEEVTLMNIWAATSHDSPITRATELREMLDAEKEKSKRWESRAWKILQIAKDKSMESFSHSIRIAKLEADLAAVGNTEQNTKLKWEQTFKANPWDGVSVCATYMGLDFHIELQDDGKFEMSAMLHGALYGFGKVAIRQRAINQMDKIFNEMLQDPIDVMRIAERYAKD